MWNLKNAELIETENRLEVARGRGGKIGESGQKIQTSSQKV